MAMSHVRERAKVRDVPFARPMIGEEEREAVAEVLRGSTLVHGPKAEEFERVFRDFTGAPEAVSVSSCTAAMHLIYLYLGLVKGDEVIVPAQTHVATAHAVEITGAKPVFADADPATGNIDVRLLPELITERTRAIAVVHFLGLPAEMEAAVAVARKHDLFVVEDCALALGSYVDDVHAGLLGDVGCFSFYPVKHITTAEGGMLITLHQGLAEKVRRLRAFGVDRTPAERTVPGMYDAPDLGINYRLNELQAAMGVEQMKKLPDFLSARRRNAEILREELAEVTGLSLLPAGDGQFVSSNYCLGVLLDESLAERKGALVDYMRSRGVGTSVYYPQPVPHLSYYRKKYGYTLDSFPGSASISRRIIALPVGPHLGEEDMRHIVAVFKDAVAQR